MKAPIIVTYSSLAKFRNCPRAYQYREIEEIVPVSFVSDPLTFGKLTHKGLEVWLTHHDKEAVMQTIKAELDGSGWAWNDPRSQQVWAIVIGYINYYADHDTWTVEAVEAEFHHQIDETFVIRGKVDGIVSDNKMRYILEHKTAGLVNYNYLNRLQMDFQAMTYAYFYPLFSGSPIVGVIYDILQKTSIRLKKNESIDEYAERLHEIYRNPEMFHRESLHFNREEMADYREELDATLRLLWHAYEEHGCGYAHAFAKNTQFCFSWNRSCPYLALCKSLDNPTIKANHFKHERAHAELSDPGEIPF